MRLESMGEAWTMKVETDDNLVTNPETHQIYKSGSPSIVPHHPRRKAALLMTNRRIFWFFWSLHESSFQAVLPVWLF